MLRARFPLAACLGFLALLSFPAAAHDQDILRIAVEPLGENSYFIRIERPLILPLPLNAVWPEQCEAVRTATTLRRIDFHLTCSEPFADSDTLAIPIGSEGAFVTLLGQDAMDGAFHAGAEGGVIIPLGQLESPQELSWGETAGRYGFLGFEHILIGWDHLAFVACLVFLITGWRLLVLVTAFTAGHSLSLALSFLGFINIPSPPVEAIIALSIAFMAREALLGKGNRPGRRSALIVGLFGLLHGLGFASVLTALGIGTGERITGLLFFNLGVEAGQIAFVAALIALLFLLKKTVPQLQARPALLYALGSLGLFWFVERVAGFPVFA